MKKSFLTSLAVLLLLPFLGQTVNATNTHKTSNKSVKVVKTAKKNKNKIRSNHTVATYAKISYVVLNRNTHFVNSQNKKTKKIAKKGIGQRIYYVRYSGKNIYYGTKSKNWLPSSATRGSVWYKEDASNTMVLTTNKKGKLSYQLYAPVKVTSLVLKHNAYVYNDQGLLNRGTVAVLKKGTHVKGYSIKKLRGNKFYITDHGWIKAGNLKKTKKK